MDTGPSPDGDAPHAILPVRNMVEAAIESRQQRIGQVGPIDLIVAHTHGHGDHASWDDQFIARPYTTVVAPTLGSVRAFFGLENWPEGPGEVDLGGRRLIVLPIPGHEADHIEVDDRGYVYAADRANTGLHILELTGEARKIANFAK